MQQPHMLELEQALADYNQAREELWKAIEEHGTKISDITIATGTTLEELQETIEWIQELTETIREMKKKDDI